ncbi:unnamed protein product [Blepharisma stoltei]|uniref:O-acyltransferase n=1 Tax=Blepharisma stoltei TaxID=1481888 RepID=A0AAU9K8P9_9CILI|nr:unnamed protein product [Blepharisma stoltei]
MSDKDTKDLGYTMVRPSFFDLADPNAGIYKCELKGLYILLVLISTFYIGISAVQRFSSVGYFWEDALFWAMAKDWLIVALAYPFLFAYSFMAYFLQILIIKGLSYNLSVVFQHLSQGFMFLVVSYIIVTWDCGFSQTMYMTILCFCFFMKMHSYTMVNRDLRENQDKSENKYPKNITIANYANYLLTPVLIYQLSYPRIPKFRPEYFFKKLILLFFQLFSMYVITSDHIMPALARGKSIQFLDLYCRLILPTLIVYLLIFFVAFEQILNLLAEISRFGDREFYQDWWNSLSQSDFARKWNRPIHLFLYKHVYLELRTRYGFKNMASSLFTLLFSSLCHEMIAALICKKIRFYLLGIMWLQFPLIFLVKTVKNDLFGLYLFLIGIIAGPPLILTLYAVSI